MSYWRQSSLLLATSLLLVLATPGVASQRKSYRGWVVLHTAPLSDAKGLSAVAALDSVRSVLLLVLGTPQRGAVIAVAPHVVDDVTRRLSAAGVAYTVKTKDLERSFEAARKAARTLPKLPKGGVAFDRFMTLDQINAYLVVLARRYPGLVKLRTIGKSTEGRNIRLVQVGVPKLGAAKPAIFIDATIHAREWLAPCVVLYTLQQLVENYTANADLLADLDWYLLPVLNPDGYEFSHKTDRLWRKTRSKHGGNDPGCTGVDANRNYDFHWGGNGSSSDACSQRYAGPKPFSEPEARQHAAFLRTHNDSISLYLTVHSYGELLLYPWSWTNDYPDNKDELHALGLVATSALTAVHGTNYSVGSTANTLYLAAGTSVDYAKGVPGTRFSYVLELPKGGDSGYDPKPSAIWPVVTETFQLIKVLAAVASGNRQRPVAGGR